MVPLLDKHASELVPLHWVVASGAKLNVACKEDAHSSSDRIQEARSSVAMLRFAPLPFHVKVELLSALSVSKGLYACSVSQLSKRQRVLRCSLRM